MSENYPDMCVGFLFSTKNTIKVLLLEKDKPQWMKGKFNGVGGKIESGESAHEAMRREFVEEIGFDISWELYCCILDVRFQLSVFRAFVEEMPELPRENDVNEKLRVFEIDELLLLRRLCVYNIPWLIMMGLDKSVKPAVIKSELKGILND